MFERFTGRTRRAITGAGHEAALLGERVIEPEHVLLAMLGDPDAVATQVLDAHGITRDRVRDEVVRHRSEVLSSIGVDLEAVTAAVEEAFGARALERAGLRGKDRRVKVSGNTRKLLELALREAIALDHNYIGTEHILLAMRRLGTGPAADLLAAALPDIDVLRDELLAVFTSRSPRRG
jgi:ATP-dependent Clp protease ATP-binding subunit ClpA